MSGESTQASPSQVYLRTWYHIGILGDSGTSSWVQVRVLRMTTPDSPGPGSADMYIPVRSAEGFHSSTLSVEEAQRLLAALELMRAKAPRIVNEGNFQAPKQQIVFNNEKGFEVSCDSARLTIHSGDTDYETTPAALNTFIGLVTKGIERMKAPAPTL